MPRFVLSDSKIQDQLVSAVSKIQADYAEIRAESSQSTRVSFKGKNPELIAQPDSVGFFIRVLINGSWGIATFSDINLLKQKLAQAIEFAKLQGQGDIFLGEPSSNKATILGSLKTDFRTVPLSKKVALVKHYSGLLWSAGKTIQTTNISYSDNYLTKLFVNSHGARVFQERPYIKLGYRAMAKVGDVIEMFRGSTGQIGGYEVVERLDQNIKKVSSEAVIQAKAPKVKSGKYTVILDPFMAGTFAHEAFGHLSEADHQYESPKLLEQMAVGKKLGTDKVTIVDDPSFPNGWGNYVYDDEGMLARKVSLLTSGVITGRLHSLETSAKLKEFPNGHARADGYLSKPIIRMSNTYFESGKDKFKELVSSTKHGILVVDWLAGMTAMENFTFTGMYGVMIENGKLTGRVRGVKLAGNVFETLNNIDGVSDDFGLDDGMCGKNGQSMPVGSGGAYVRVQNTVVGGE